MLLHIFVMSPLYIKKGVVYFGKMSLAWEWNLGAQQSMVV